MMALHPLLVVPQAQLVLLLAHSLSPTWLTRALLSPSFDLL